MGYLKLVLTWIIMIVSVLPLCLASLRVINGKPIEITGAPYAAALFANSAGHVCGGTIIAPRVIASAGHCVDGMVISHVRVGSVDDREGGQLIEVQESVLHEKYLAIHDIDATYDYAVVILKEPVTYNENVTYATLAREPLPDGTMMTLSGWGDKTVLEQTRIPLYNQTECIANYKYIPIEIDPEVAFCAGYKYANSTSCFGDSGGPLVYGPRQLYGIVSWGIDSCIDQDFPPVFAKVHTMVDWFQKFIDQYQ